MASASAPKPPEGVRAGPVQGVLLACATVLVVIAISPFFPILPRIAAAYPAHAGLAPLAVVLPSLLIGLLSIPAGVLGDRIGRRPVLIASALLFALAAPAPYLFHDFWAFLACRILAGVALSGLLTASVGATADYFPPAERERWLALQSGLPSIAAILCGALGGVLGDIDWRLAFLPGAAGLLFAAGVIFLTSDRMRLAAPAAPAAAPIEADMPAPWRLLVVIGALAIWTSLIVFPIAYEIGFLFADRHIANSSLAGLGSAALAGGAMLGALMAGTLTQVSARGKLAISFGASAFGMLAFTVTTSLPLALVACLISGIAQGAIIPVLAAFLLNGCPPVWRGRSVGVFQAALYLSQFASPLASRWAAQGLGGDAAMRIYATAAALTVVVIGLTVFVSPTRARPAMPTGRP